MLSQWMPVAFVCIVSYVTISLFIPLARKIKLLDIPQGRKDHDGHIPLVGGISIYISIILSSIIFYDLPTSLMGFLAISGIITMVGSLDDKYSLPANFRFWIQILSGIALAFGAGISLRSFGDLINTGPIGLGFLAIPISAIAITGITNAYNMADGIDGLTGSMSLIALSSLAILVYNNATEAEIYVLMFYAISLCIFLIFNLQLFSKSRQKIFLGDAGSMFLGFSIASFMIYFSQGERAIIKPVTALWLVAVPLMDMVSTMIRRILKKRSPFNADKTHLHHILVKGGFSQKQALVVLIIYGGVCAATGIALASAPEYINFLCFILLFSFHLYFFRHAYKASKQIKRSIIISKGVARKLISNI